MNIRSRLRSMVIITGLMIPCVPTIVAQDEKPVVLLAGVSLAKKDPKSEFGQSYSQFIQPGTSVDIFFAVPGRSIISLDTKQTSLKLSSDDNGEMTLREQFDGTVQMRLREERDSGILQLASDDIPGAKTGKLSIEGTCALVMGMAPKTESVKVKLAEGTKVKIGTLDATVGQIGPAFGDPYKQTLELSAKTSFDAISKVEFLDAKGNVIESGGAGGGSFGFAGDVTYSQSWQIASEDKEVTMRVTMFTKTETLKLPIKLQFGLGL